MGKQPRPITKSAVRCKRDCALCRGWTTCGQVGERNQATGRSRGSRTTKTHALADGFGRPIAFLPTGGQAADYQAAERLLDQGCRTGSSRVPTGATIPTGCVTRSKAMAAPPTSRHDAIGAAKTASHPPSAAAATPSSGCSAVSKTIAVSPPATTASLKNFLPAVALIAIITARTE